MTPLLTPEEQSLLERNKSWMKCVLELWSESRDGMSPKKELTEYGYYFSLLDSEIITMDEFDKLIAGIDNLGTKIEGE